MDIEIPSYEELNDMTNEEIVQLNDEISDLPEKKEVAAEKRLYRELTKAAKREDFDIPTYFKEDADVTVLYISTRQTRRARKEISGTITAISTEEMVIKERIGRYNDSPPRTIIVNLEEFDVISQTEKQSQKIGDLFNITVVTLAEQADEPFMDRMSLQLMGDGAHDWEREGPFKYPSNEFFDEKYDKDQNPEEHVY